MIGGGVSGIDAERFHGVDRLQHTFDLRPTVDPQQNFAAWADERQRLIGFAAVDRARDVDPRDDRAEVVRGPANECKDALWRKAQNAAATVEDRLAAVMSEADPVLDAPFEPGQFDLGLQRPGVGSRSAHSVGIAPHERSPLVWGNLRADRSRSVSATVTPR